MTNLQDYIKQIKAARHPDVCFHTLALPAEDKIALFDALMNDDSIFERCLTVKSLNTLIDLVSSHSEPELADILCDVLIKHQKKMATLMKRDLIFAGYLLLLLKKLYSMSPNKVTELLLNKPGQTCFYEKIQNLFLNQVNPSSQSDYKAYLWLFSFSPLPIDNPEYFTLMLKHYEILHRHARYNRHIEHDRARTWQRMIDLYESGHLPFTLLLNFIEHLIKEKTNLSYHSDALSMIQIQQFALNNLQGEDFNTFMQTIEFPAWRTHSYYQSQLEDDFSYISLSFKLIEKWLDQNPPLIPFDKVLSKLKDLQFEILIFNPQCGLITDYLTLLLKLEKKMSPRIEDTHEKIMSLFTAESGSKTFSHSLSRLMKTPENTFLILELITSNFLPLTELSKLKNWKDHIAALLIGKYDGNNYSNDLEGGRKRKILTSMFENPHEALHEFMAIKRGIKKTSYKSGCLGACYKEAIKLGIIANQEQLIARASAPSAPPCPLSHRNMFSSASGSGLAAAYTPSK